MSEPKAQESTTARFSQEKQRAIRLSMVTSSSLFIMKVTIGLLSGSLAVLAEAANSFLDFISSSFTMIVIRHADEPPDEDHPYGHGKFENIATVVQAMLIMLTGSLILYKGAYAFGQEHEIKHMPLAIGVMTVSGIVSLLIANFLERKARQTHSQALHADSTHFMTDVYSNAGVLVALIAVRLTEWHWLDPIIAIFVGLIIIKSSWDLLATAFYDLTDHELLGDSRVQLQSILDRHKDCILDVHKLRTRRSGPNKIIDMHLTVCRQLSFVAAHDFVDMLENEIETQLAPANALIHADPCEDNCDQIRSCVKANYKSNTTAPANTSSAHD